MIETWKAIPGYEGYYEVSDQGRVRSLDRWIDTKQGPRFRRGVVRKPKRGTHGYWELPLNLDGRERTHTVHSLMMLAFVGPRPDGQEVLHGDDDKDNNTLENLRYGTKPENMQDAIKNGRNPQRSKLKCVNGHDFSDENTGWDKHGRRWCKTCRRACIRAHYRNNPDYYKARNERRRKKEAAA